MNQLNTYLMSTLEKTARLLWENKKYSHAGDILNMATEYANTPQELRALLDNARMCYFHANQVPRALACIDRCLAQQLPVEWNMYRDRANYLRYLNRYQEAEQCLEQVQDPDTKNLARSWFLHRKGFYKQAFESAELARKSYWWGTRKPLDLPLWDRQYHDKIVIFGESGAGDEIIFARFINLIRPYCRELYYYTDNSLLQVFCRNFNVLPYDPKMTDCVMVPAMSMSYLLELTEPSNVPYITSDPALAARYTKDRTRIGLCFHGDPDHYETNLRTLPEELLVDSFSDLAEVVNLQYGYISKNKNLVQYSFNTWEETFALLDTCDFIVTCDTSIAHAAGALGKPVIVLMHGAAYFTWNHNEPMGTSTWYKQSYCIKQTEPCQWEGSIEQARKLIMEILK